MWVSAHEIFVAIKRFLIVASVGTGNCRNMCVMLDDAVVLGWLVLFLMSTYGSMTPRAFLVVVGREIAMDLK